MKDSFFPSNPIADLLIRNRDSKYIQDKYLDGVSFVDRSSQIDLKSLDLDSLNREFIFKAKDEEKECIDLFRAYPEIYYDGYRRIEQFQT